MYSFLLLEDYSSMTESNLTLKSLYCKTYQTKVEAKKKKKEEEYCVNKQNGFINLIIVRLILKYKIRNRCFFLQTQYPFAPQ